MRLKLQSLLRTIEELGDPTCDVMPVDEIRLASLLAEHLSDELAAALLGLFRHPNMHARRVALQAVRRASFWSNPAVATAVIECLDDPDGWVRYDAARALGARGARSADVVVNLRRLSAGTSPNDTFDMDDDAQQARVAAAKALMDIGAPTDSGVDASSETARSRRGGSSPE